MDHVIVNRNLRHRHLSMADEAQAECPGLSYPLSLVVVDHTASSIRTTHKAASGFIYPFERGLIFVHAQRAIEACSVWFAHTRVYPTLRAIVAQYYMLYTICYSSLTDSANTTSNIAIPYDSAFS